MDKLPIEVEMYPRIGSEDKLKGIEAIDRNKGHWPEPFFMDVYKYADIDEFKEKCKSIMENPNIKNVIILGTGGSYQTMKAMELFSHKNLYFLTSSRPNELSYVLSITTPEDSVVVPISRGGKTLDVNSILPSFKDYPMIALSSQGPMYEMVSKLGATIIPVPDLSGRFAASVCSVALVPMLLSGINVEDFQRGLEDGYSIFKDLRSEMNYALDYAIFLDKLYKRGYRNVFSMPYSVWLEGAVGLFVQEISESSGKENKGLLGTAQPAPLCQHSVLELLLGGSKGHTTPLLWTTLSEPVDVQLESIEGMKLNTDGKSALEIINYQLDATFQALLTQAIPSAKISLKDISVYNMGILISWIQSMVYYYCIINDVDWSSNPLVNLGKKICNEAIEKNLSYEERKKAREQIAAEKFNY